MKRLTTWLILAFLFVQLSCHTSKIRPETGQMQIGAYRKDCTGVGPMKCLLVKEEGSADWHYFYSEIEGFTHEEGYEYTIQVRKETVPDPPADGSSIRYILVKEIEKVKK
ncbi:hypothetical protein GCM10028806_52820 [Spirosoma terrae]|uniref:DUF4377 domain-containing protein n=1 Tax=Spirosoma terrae TaxID=1968276 RepID=A0A6L9LDR1_9BACT|nr:DUF4377 domain-containing protein [Spirosoma terrae]NDU96638.1 DUF4377 domain-containing protein [Spirosoma terrae]